MQKAKVYVGVDSHSKFHKAAVLPAFLMEGTTVGDEDYWDKEVKPKLERYQFGNDRDSYQGFDEALQALAAPEQVVIGLEYTGGHYTAPLTYFLSGLGYQLWFIEAKAFKEFKEKFLGQRNKTDKVDSAEMSFYLYARAALQRKLRISIIKPEIGTESAILKNLIIQRWSTQKSINQTTNRLHQLLIASFPEGEAAYFDQLLTIIQEYPTPRAILDESSGQA